MNLDRDAIKLAREQLAKRSYIMKMHLVILSLGAALAYSSHAGVLFFDDFNGENQGVSAPNWNAFANWRVTSGAVDIIGNGSWDLQPGNGLYVDLDGTAGAAGTMVTRNVLNLGAGDYVLSFRLAGHLRPQYGVNDEPVFVEVGSGLAAQTYTLPYSAGFETFTLPFSLTSPQAVNLKFQGFGGDNVGPLLDDVKLESRQVPDNGSTLGLLLLVAPALFLIRARPELRMASQS